jgi:hypothetical protein
MTSTHIKNLYEANDLTLLDLQEILGLAFSGKLENASEKLDGQNLTFMFDSKGKVRFLGKGVISWIKERGGLTIDEVKEQYVDRPSVKQCFVASLDALQKAYDKNPAFRFQIGNNYAWNAETVNRVNPNVIKYDSDFVCILECLECPMKILFDDDKLGLIDQRVRFRKPLRFIASEVNPPSFIQSDEQGQMTVGRAKAGKLYYSLQRHFPNLRDDENLAMAMRLVTGDTKFFQHKRVSKGAWQAFKSIENDTTFVVMQTLAFEKRIQQCSYEAIKCYEFLNSNPHDETMIEESMQFAKSVERALVEKKLITSKPVYTRCYESLLRFTPSFLLNVEGIVFNYKGQLLKLSGTFPAFNALKGCFTYGEARIEE